VYDQSPDSLEPESVPFSPFVPECGKVGHPSRKIALANLRRIIAGLDSYAKDRESLGIFRCDRCAQWHCGNSDVSRAKPPAPRVRRPSNSLRATLDYNPDGDE
jgi:hypothetical protein